MLKTNFSYAVLLTLAGAIPFLFCGGLVLLYPVDSPLAIQALIAYGAVILSFVGAVHWGFVLSRPEPSDTAGTDKRSLGLGVLPALVGWVALLVQLRFHLPALALFFLLAGFLLTVIAETVGHGRGVVPSSYLILRWSISVIVMLVLLAVLVALLAGMRTG
jgi:hypothetical protein